MTKTPNNPIFSLAERKIRGVLALVTATVGPSYRSVGASMVFTEDGKRIGSLSSGCIENDLELHARDVRASGVPKVITYGVGSPFVDIKLPCGGALEIVLVAQPNNDELDLILDVLVKRTESTVTISKRSGAIRLLSSTQSSLDPSQFQLRLTPPLRFCVFGKGPEAENFVQLAHSLGYEGKLLSPDPETLDAAPTSRWGSVLLVNRHCPSDLGIDRHTAVVLFFHDHEWEASILKDVLDSDAFYIGAQGSMRARETRARELDALGVDKAQRARIVGPIGLIPSTRDPQTLAVSVFAEVLHKAQAL